MCKIFEKKSLEMYQRHVWSTNDHQMCANPSFTLNTDFLQFDKNACFTTTKSVKHSRLQNKTHPYLLKQLHFYFLVGFGHLVSE